MQLKPVFLRRAFLFGENMSWNSIGVPSVPGLPKNIGDAVIKFGGGQIINSFFGNYWGVFDQNGLPLLLVDNVKSVKFQNRSKISNSPVEAGSFTSYNKVVEPYSVSVVMTKGSGGVTERGAFLGILDAFSNSTDLFMVITPEAVYPNCNITGYDYVREHNDGARLIKANVHLQEVREVKVSYTKEKAPTVATEQNAGNATPAQAAKSNDSVLSWFKDKSISEIGKELAEKAKEIVKEIF
ncbi:phage baseplate protein [Testudinibacter sp. P80/BLE/0925]